MTATAKKMLSVFMAFVLVFTLTPTVAFGGNEGEGEGGTDEAALQTSSTDEKPDGTDTFVVNDTLLPEVVEEDGPQDAGAIVKQAAVVEEEADESDDPADETQNAKVDEQSMLMIASDGTLTEASAQEVTPTSEQQYTYTDSSAGFTLFYKTCSYVDGDQTGSGVAIRGIRADSNNVTVTIPGKISRDGTEYDVVALGLTDDFSWDNAGHVSKVIIPSSVKFVNKIMFGSNVTSEVRFDGNSSITELYTGIFQNFYGSSVTLPNSLVTVSSQMFQGSRITTINLPDTVTRINSNAISDTGSLATVTLGSGLEIIGIDAFATTKITESDIPKFTSITIPANVTAIQDKAFYKNTKLGADNGNLTFDEGSKLTTIGNYAFYGTSLQSVTIPDNVESIGVGAFSGKNGTDSIDGDENLTSTNGSYTLTSVTFGSNSRLTTLGARAFAKQPITEVVLPKNLTSFGYNNSTNKPNENGDMFYFGGSGSANNSSEHALGAFAGCAQLASITWPTGGGLKTVGGFNDCTSLTAAAVNSLPASVTRIDDYAFYNCTNIGSGQGDNNSEVIIPTTVAAIGKGAFSKKSGSTTTSKTFTLQNKGVSIEWDNDKGVSTGPWPLGCGYAIKYPRSVGDDTAYSIVAYRNAVQTYEAAQGISDENKTKFVPVADNFYTVTGKVPAGASVRLYVNGTMQECELDSDNSFTSRYIEEGSLVGAVVSMDGYQDYTVSPTDGENVAELKANWTFDATDKLVALSDLGILQVTATGSYRANCNVAVFDDAGKLVSQGNALRCSQGNAEEAPVYVVDGIPQGNYTVVGWQENDYFSRVSSIDDFAAMGFSADDYATAPATVNKGGTTTVNLAIPQLDTSKISAVLATGDVTIASYYNPIEVPFTAIVNYNMTTGQKVDRVQVSIPDGLEPLAAATTAKRYYSTVDSINTDSWDAPNHVLTISGLDAADTQSGKIALSLKATTAGSYAVSASLKSGSTTAPLGGASVECPAIRLVVPEGTLSSKTFTVHVYAEPNSDVVLKIGDTVLDTACKTNLVGHAKVSVTIPDKELSFSTYYQVTATLKDSTENPQPSDTALVEYNAYLDEIPLEPTVYDFWFESAGQKVVLSDAGEERSGGFYTVATAQHRIIFSTAWPFTASIDSLQPLGDEATLYLGMLDNSVRDFTLSLSNTENLASGAKRYTYSAIVELNLDGKDDWRADEVPCRFDVMPGIAPVETVQPDWSTSTNMETLKLGVNTDVDRLSAKGAKGFNDWYDSLNETGKKCVSGEYFYTSKLGTTYGYKFYNGTLAQNNYDYVFGVFNNSFRHEKWDPTGAVWNQMSPAERTAFLEAEEQVATAYDALALLLGDSKPMYAYETYEAYLAAECGYTTDDSYDKSALEDEGYLVVDNLFDGISWTAVRADVPDDGKALPTIDGLRMSTQSVVKDRIGSFQTKDGRGEAANKRINGMTDVDIAIDTIKESTESVMSVVNKIDPETAGLINGFAVKAAGLAKSIYEPIDDEIKSRSDYTGISSELKNRQEELARMEEMNKFYDRKNPGSLCQKALQAEIEYIKQYIADLEWAKRFAWYGQMGTVVGGAMIEYTGKIDDAAKGYINTLNGDAQEAANIAWDYIGGILDKGKIAGLAARQAYGSQAALASMVMAPDLAKHRAQVQQWRFYRERECKEGDFGELHYHVKPAIDPSGWTYEAVQDNRLEGVTATIYQYVNDTWKVWDATEYDQVNPQTTTAAGLYAWDVPEGDWKVLFQKAGYLGKWSDVMHVLPAWVNVAINMLRADASQVASAAGNDEDPYAPYVDITFNQYMNASDGAMPTVTVNGTAVTGAYWVDVVTGTVVTEADVEDEDAKVSLVLRVPLADLAEPGDTVEVSVTGASSYTGTQMAAPYTATVTIPDSATYYYVTPDETATFTKGSNEELSFTFKRTAYDERTFPRFQGILVDGATVDASNYTAVAGSVVVTLKAAYLETLAEGDHTLTAQFADGGATADFKVAAAPKAGWTRGASSPATGDRTAPMNALLLTAAIACVVMLVARNRANAHKPIGKHTRR